MTRWIQFYNINMTATAEKKVAKRTLVYIQMACQESQSLTCFQVSLFLLFHQVFALLSTKAFKN